MTDHNKQLAIQDQSNWLKTFFQWTGLEPTKIVGYGSQSTFEEYAANCMKTYAKQITDAQLAVNGHKLNYDKLHSLMPNSFALPPLNKKQASVLKLLNAWMDTRTPYYILAGYAGTGKTFLLQHFAKHLMRSDVLFSSPTNKATKVLRKLLPDHYCKTIYSILGLKMVQREDELVLSSSGEKVDLSGYKVVVVDEASMLNTELMKYIDEARKQWGIKFLFVGDPAQLPPVGEDLSPVWKLECQRSLLTDVVRHDNQILTLATHIRDHIESGTKLTHIDLDEGKRCVWQLSRAGFIERIRKHARGGFQNMRAVAWRNSTVDMLNEVIRQQIFTPEHLAFGRWVVGDQIVMTEPIEEFGKIIATVDDEGVVTHSAISIDYETGFKCYHVQVKMEAGNTLHIRAIHEESEHEFSERLGMYAHEARQPGQGKMWRKFWGLKYRFHSIRHSFAITAHRAQGSTFKYVFVDATDILRNTDRDTALRCLYVGASRPSHKLFITGLP